MKQQVCDAPPEVPVDDPLRDARPGPHRASPQPLSLAGRWSLFGNESLPKPSACLVDETTNLDRACRLVVSTALVPRNGERAPGEGGERGLWVAPSASAWGRIPSGEWLRAGVDGARSAATVRAAGAAGRLEQCVGLPPDDAHRRLRAMPGIGICTAAEVRYTALGDADAVNFGDYHVANHIG